MGEAPYVPYHGAMRMANKEAQQKQDKDSSPAAIPKQGEIENQIERI